MSIVSYHVFTTAEDLKWMKQNRSSFPPHHLLSCNASDAAHTTRWGCQTKIFIPNKITFLALNEVTTKTNCKNVVRTRTEPGIFLEVE